MKVAIIGAGSIGCYVGGALAANGAEVTFLGRQAKGASLAKTGITCKPLESKTTATIQPDWAISAQAMPEADTYLVCVKSHDTEATATLLKTIIPVGANVVSLQNGLENHAVLQNNLSETANVFSAIVVFNVVEEPIGTFAATTEGGIYLQNAPNMEKLSAALNASDIETHLRDDIEGVAYAKLLMNLNNALNALSGQPLLEQVRDREWRLVLAAMMDEGLAIAKALNRPVPKIGKVKPTLIPTILRLPNFAFTRIAGAMLKIDPTARSSMADDLSLGRKPEVDYLNGALVALGKTVNIPTPVNARVTQAVHRLFEGAEATTTPQELLRGK